MLVSLRSIIKVMGMAILPAVFLVFAGCSSNSGTTGPDENPEPQKQVINTPVSLIVQKITVTAFPAHKSNGDTWDWDPFSATQRKPDIYVTMGEKNKTADYRSVTMKNANSSNDYNLSSKHKKSSKSLPYTMKYKDSYTFALYEDDGLLADDKMGSGTVYTSDLYKKDNAINFTETINCSKGVKIKIEGVWTY